MMLLHDFESPAGDLRRREHALSEANRLRIEGERRFRPRCAVGFVTRQSFREEAQQPRRFVAALNAGGKSPAFEKLRTEKAAVEEQLRVARDERSKLQRDINAIQQQAESSWATERMENALLRERINDIAAEVAKLAMTLEGPNSAIEAMLSAEPVTAKPVAKPANATPANGAANGNLPETGGTLAERIRALQSHASRARQQGA